MDSIISRADLRGRANGCRMRRLEPACDHYYADCSHKLRGQDGEDSAVYRENRRRDERHSRDEDCQPQHHRNDLRLLR